MTNKIPNQSPNQILQQFHTIAVQKKLSAAAILLWQYVYFAAAAQNKYSDLYLRTADVLDVLSITRNGLQKVRRTLIGAGLLNVRIDHRQQVYYTLTIDGVAVADTGHAPKSKTEIKPETATETKTKNKTTSQSRCKAAANVQAKPKNLAPAKPYIPDAQYPGDIMQNDTYRKLIKSFCSRFDPQEGSRLEISLHHFLHRRKQLGKTLTKAGLDAILDKLVNLAEENVRTMVHIVEQSIQRGWMGVYAYSGNTANTNRRQNNHQPSTQRFARPSSIPAYDTAYVDLSFLER